MDLNDAHSAAAASALVTKHTLYAAGFGAALVTAVVMTATMPTRKTDFFIALLSTVVCSVALGAWGVQHFGMVEALLTVKTDLQFYVQLAQIGGVFFAAGLPGWIVVRAFFIWAQARRELGLDALIADARKVIHDNKNH